MSDDIEKRRAANDATRPDPFDAAARHANELERRLAEANRVGKLQAAALVLAQDTCLCQGRDDYDPEYPRTVVMGTGKREPCQSCEASTAAIAEARKMGWLA